MATVPRPRATAAAALLGALGAFFAAQPAAAQAVVGYAKPALTAHQRDILGPVISVVTPSHGDRVGNRGLTQISAHFADDGSGVDMRYLVLRVDGHDVTHRAEVDRDRDGRGDHIRFADDLRPGRHVAELAVRDRAGNASRRAWSFDVVERGRNFSYNGR